MRELLRRGFATALLIVASHASVLSATADHESAPGAASPALQQAPPPPEHAPSSRSGGGPSETMSPPLMARPDRVPRTPPSVLQFMDAGRWAIVTAGNCAIPKKSYLMSLDGPRILWHGGDGALDIEQINDDTEMSAHSVTIESHHPQGPNEQPGTRWAYFKADGDLIMVTKLGGGSFTLVRCP